MNMLMVLGLGLLLGLQHATEADHLAAVATFCGREHSLKEGLRLGLAWGLGRSAARLTLLNGGFNTVVAGLSVLLCLRLLVVNG